MMYIHNVYYYYIYTHNIPRFTDSKVASTTAADISLLLCIYKYIYIYILMYIYTLLHT